VQRWPWAKVGVETWQHNLRQGFVWDNDCFLDNQLAHPYHGSMYHNSARASGYGFWSATPFVAAGSASWELFGENIRASLNDLISTTLGGVALGEVTYRLSGRLGSRHGKRAGLGRELGAFIASPVATTHELLNGRGPDITDAASSSIPVPSRFSIGREGRHGFVELAVQYGTPFSADFARPYDAFEFRMRLSPTSDTVVHQVGISGLLARYQLSQSRHGQLLFGVFQHFDYEDLPGIKTSGQSVSTALLYQRRFDRRHWMTLSAHAEGLLLGGISSDHGFYWRRDFDLGPGAGARFAASLSRDDREWLQLDSRILWLHSLHGSDADHFMTSIRVGAAIPIAGTLGVGGDVALTTRHSRYRDFPAAGTRVHQLRGFVSWMP
jgi:hypothetical protein